MNSNIQYQFLKYNGFKPMNVPAAHYEVDKVETNFSRPPQHGLADFSLPSERFAHIYGNSTLTNEWQFGLLRYDPF